MWMRPVYIGMHVTFKISITVWAVRNAGSKSQRVFNCHVHNSHSKGENTSLLHPPGCKDKFQRSKRGMRRGEKEGEGRERIREGDGQQRKSTAHSSIPRSLSQLGLIVMESQ